MLPDWTLEDECAASADGPVGPICGIDEAGRGPWAGPVIAAAVILDRSALPEGIDDSKRLSAPIRARLHDEIMASARVGIGIGSVIEIERLNIVHANDLAMARALDALGRSPSIALVDGKWRPKTITTPMRTVIGGDALSLSIAAASIIAKVTRDRIMQKLDGEYPGYGWHRNVGYGTREHRDALTRLGVTPHHRRLWAPVAKILETVGEAKGSHQESSVTI